MTVHTDANMIEQDIDRDRADLAATLDELQDRVSVESLAQNALGFLRDNTADYTKSVDAAVRANPMALGLVGIGLAWLVFGSKKADEPAKTKLKAMTTWENEGGPARPSDEHGTDWSQASDSLRSKATSALHKLEQEAKNATAGIRDFAAERAAVVADFTEGLRSSLRHGLEGLSDMAQDKIVAVRESAYSAGLSMDRMHPRNTGRMIEDHPMVAGAVMMALGAALGSALPRSDIEDRTFGAERDRLMDQASRMLAEERSAVMRIAGEIKTDIVGTARDTMNSVADSVVRASENVSDKMANAASNS